MKSEKYGSVIIGSHENEGQSDRAQIKYIYIYNEKDPKIKSARPRIAWSFL